MKSCYFAFKLLALILVSVVAGQTSVHAQITRETARGGNQVASLQDILVNKLRATREDQQVFIAAVVQEANQGNVEKGFVLAVMRYAIDKNPRYPFPYFERAVRFEATKRRITLPAVEIILSTRDPRRR
jgi:hypothetical protein